MNSFFTKYFFICGTLFLGLLPTNISFAQNKCLEVFQTDTFILKSNFDRLFSIHSNDPSVYKPDLCHRNVIYLFDLFRAHNPLIKSHDFKVLFITTPQFTKNLSSHDFAFSGKVGRGFSPDGDKPGYVRWRYHVALEFEGRIYDLDFTNNPQPVNRRTYLNEMFFDWKTVKKSNGELSGPKSQLIVYAIPGENYLEMGDMKVGTVGFQQNIVDNNIAFPLIDYMNEPISN